jgi:hypothetical protein
MSNASVIESFGRAGSASHDGVRASAHFSARFSEGAAALVVMAVASACGGHSLRLVSPDTTAGPRYTCEPGAERSCQPATSDVPEELNPSGTLFVILPRECKGRIHQLVIIDAGSSDPKVDATCAPEEAPLEEMSRRERNQEGESAHGRVTAH